MVSLGLVLASCVGVLGLLGLLWLLRRWLLVRRYWQLRAVPHRKPHWLFGSLTFLMKENPSSWMLRLSRDLNVPYFGIWLFWKPALVVQSPELAKRILMKDSDVFRDRHLKSARNSDPTGALSLFAVKDPLWSSIRRRLTVVFTAAKLRSLHPLLRCKADQLIIRIKEESDSGRPFDTQSLFTDFTTDIIGTAAFGVDSNATVTGEGAMRRVTRDMQYFSLFRALSWGSIFFLPQLVEIFRFSLFSKATVAYLSNVWRAVVAQRGGYERKVTDTRDLVDALLKMKQEATLDGEVMSEDLLIAQAAVFVLGGFETTGSTMSFTLLELAYQPEIQDKLYEELLEAKERADGKDLDMTMLSQLTYLNCVIKETLRKYNAMGWFDRIASEDYQIDEHLTIPAGTPVYVNGIGMHYDPQYWPAPETYDPDRFLPENQKNMESFTYIPFGEGPRMCIGRRFGMQTLWYGLSSIFLNYTVRPMASTKPPHQMPWSNKNMLLVPGEPVRVQFVPRN